MATFVLVHGAFQGGWVWGRVADLLHSRGHDVHTPTLSGCGYLAKAVHQESDLGVFIADIRSYIEFEDLGEIILIAHSFSGMVCGALMMQIPERIRQAVFVDAVIPEPQRSFADMAGEPFQLMLEKHRGQDGAVRPWPLQVFGVTESAAAWFEPRLRPFSYKAFHTPFPGIFDPRPVPTSYISCRETGSPFIREMAGKARRHGWSLQTINSGHCPMVTCPLELCQAIMIQVASGQDLLSFFQ
ncbi:MAG: alpha/beta hydrolase [Pseudomonadota bacterium]